MKKVLSASLLMIVGLATQVQAQNPLAGTAWQFSAHMNPEDSLQLIDGVLQFGKDTVHLYILPEKFIGETMAYTRKKNTFTLRKSSGNSPCDVNIPGTYQYTIKDGKMVLVTVKEGCKARVEALTGEPLKKVALIKK